MKKVILSLGAVFVVIGVGFLLFRYGLKVTKKSPNPLGQLSNVTSSPATLKPYVDPLPHDKDRDGLSDEEEVKLGTSDKEFDTDGDGVSDNDEINVWHSDPTKWDTDGDGFSDGQEIIKGYSPIGPGKLKK